jgi:purine-binding chemotaxis protein CheW
MNQDDLKKITSYLSFRLGSEVFALHVSKVQKILGMSEITEVPRAPDYMKGVINLRGNVLPVVDTRVKFGMTPTEKTKSTSILVIETTISGETVLLGMLVDAVQAVLKIEADDLLPPPSIGNTYQSEFIENMTKVKDKFYIILNMDAVFASDNMLNINDLIGAREAVVTQEEEKK